MLEVSEKFDKDQELIDELNRVKIQLNKYKELEYGLRECFEIGDREDLLQKMIDIRSDLETIPTLNEEYKNLQKKLTDVMENQKQ